MTFDFADGKSDGGDGEAFFEDFEVREHESADFEGDGRIHDGETTTKN